MGMQNSQDLNVRKVAIVGAGAMGAAYAAMFMDADNFAVSFVARGERYRRLERSKLTVNGRSYDIRTVHPDRITAPADLVLVALKHHHLQDAVGDIKALVDENTIILSVMNGLESEEIIGAACGIGKMVYAIAVGIDAVREDNQFRYSTPGKIIFGAGPRSAGTGRLERLEEALDRASIPNELSSDIMRVIWWKFMINVGINQASAVLRAPYGVFQSDPHARKLMRLLMGEVISLAAKLEIDLTDRDMDDFDPTLESLSPAGKTSMLQDIEAGRKTEVEIFAGKVVALGELHNVPTPVNLTALCMIKAIENSGLL
jgi:2-dehydropantoate 2-reductase